MAVNCDQEGYIPPLLLMLAQRLRRWANINSTLGARLVLTGGGRLSASFALRQTRAEALG